MKRALKDYENCCTVIEHLFCSKYFGKEYESWWVCDLIGGTLHVNDHFFNMDDMVFYIRNNVAVRDMFDYYEYSLVESLKNKIPYKFEVWKKTKKSK